MQDKNSDVPRIPNFDFTPIHTPVSTLDDLKTASFKLKQISSIIEQSVHKTKTNNMLRNHESAIIYVSIVSIILIVYLIIKCALKLRRKCRISIDYCTRLLMYGNDDNGIDNRTYDSVPQDLPSIRYVPPERIVIPQTSTPVTNPLPPTPTSPRRSTRLRERL